MTISYFKLLFRGRPRLSGSVGHWPNEDEDPQKKWQGGGPFQERPLAIGESREHLRHQSVSRRRRRCVSSLRRTISAIQIGIRRRTAGRCGIVDQDGELLADPD